MINEFTMSVSIMFSGNGDLQVKDVPSLSAKCEERGFKGIWFGETTIKDAGILSSLALLSTKSIEVGTSIVNVYTRSAGQLAMMASTLNEIGSGRFTLGVGASTPAIVSGWHGLKYERPLLRVEETVKLLKLYFSGQRFSHVGYFQSPSNARLRCSSPPKIAVAALNEKMVQLAAKIADMLILNLYPPIMIGEARKVISETGRKPRLSVMLYAYVLGEGERGFNISRDLIAFYSSSEAYVKLFKRAGFEQEADRAFRGWQARNRDAVRNAITEEMIKSLMVYGDIKTLRERVRAYQDEGVDNILVAPCPTGDYMENARLIIESF